MKKLKNLHPLKEIVVQGECITLGFLLTIGRIGGTNPISFVSASIEIPRPAIVHHGNPSSRKRYAVTWYRGKFTPKKGKR